MMRIVVAVVAVVVLAWLAVTERSLVLQERGVKATAGRTSRGPSRPSARGPAQPGHAPDL